MSIKIAAAYIRVSSDDQLEYSPDSQLTLIRDYAKREGYFVPDEYVFSDDGISGKSADKRPGFRLMIATAKDGKTPPFEAIFVWKYSRFARNQEEAIMYKGLLRRRGVDVRSISEPSTDSPFSSLIERIIEWMDEYYLINLAAEVRRGMTEKATRGEAMGTAPFGYSVANKTFIPNENAATVRYIFERYAAGAGFRDLARELDDKGVRTRRGNVPDNRWVQYILGNPAYIGKVRWSTEGHANYSRANYDNKNVLTAEGRHEPIIDPELWARVQARLKEHDTEPKNVRRKKPKIFMLKGLLRCGDCGATLVHLSTKSPSLQCHRYARGQCRVSHSISLPKANAAVIGYLEELLQTGAFRFAPQKPVSARISHDWASLIQSEENRLLRARNALLDGALTSGEFKEIRADIEANIEKLRAGQASEAAEKPAPPSADAYKAKILNVLQILKSEDVDEAEKNKALRSVIDQIVYNKPEGTFDFYFIA